MKLNFLSSIGVDKIVSGTTCIISPITIGTTCLCSPIILGSSYICSPVITGSSKVCSPIIAGTSCVTSPITIGTTCLCSPIVLGSTHVCSPLITGSTKICSPIIAGTSCVTSPITIGTTCLCSPIVLGSTCVCSPIVIGSTCVSTPIIDSATNIAICSSADIALCGIANSCTVLFYNGSARLITLSAGVCVNGILSASTSSCAVTCVIAGTCMCAGTTICALTCGVSPEWVATSDKRLKKDIRPLNNSLSIVQQLCGVSYHLCGDCDCEDNIGLIAQDVQKVFPVLVSHIKPNEEDAQYGIVDEKLGLKYDKISSLLIEAIKEQQVQILELKTEIINLKNNTL